MPLAVLTALFLILDTVPGTDEFRVSQLTTAMGLSESHVFAILQDHNGFIWFGTRDGLNRYDGYDVKVYHNDPQDPASISNNYIYALYEDKDNRLWIGTRGGLNIYDPETDAFTRIRADQDDPTALAHDTVLVIEPQETPDGLVLWLGTSGGLHRYDTTTGQFTRFLHDPDDPNSISDNAIWSLCLDLKRNQLWLGTLNGGLQVMDLDRLGHIRRLDGYLKGESFIQSIMIDAKDRVWVGLANGVAYLEDPSNMDFTIINELAGYPLGPVQAIIEKEPGKIWLGSFLNGLFLYNEAGASKVWNRSYPKGAQLNHNSVRSLYQDRLGNVWMGTYGGGVNYLTPTPFARAAPFIDDEVLGINQDAQGRLWIGTSGQGVKSADGKERRMEGFIIRVMAFDQQGDLWVGTRADGLHRFPKDGGPALIYTHNNTQGREISSSRTLALFCDSEGSIWLGTLGGGGNRIRGNEITLFRNEGRPGDINSDGIRSMYEDQNRVLWFGTMDGGLNRMSLDEPFLFQAFPHDPEDPNTISDNAVFAISTAGPNELWVGTSNGLSRFNTVTHRARNYSAASGLPSNTIYGILEDDAGMAWISTSRGLARLDPSTDKILAFDRFDGLPVEDFRPGAMLKQDDGTLLFGGAGGVVWFDPRQVTSDPNPPNTVFTQIALNNDPLKPNRLDENSPLFGSLSDTKRLDLNANVSSISLRVAPLHYTAPSKNSFAHRLLGFDDTWVIRDVDNRNITYTNLDPGTYTFEVKSANRDGVWGESRALEIYLPAPLWRSWWAILLYIIMGLSLVLWYVYTVNQRLISQKEALDNLREVELLKDRFSADLEKQVAERTRDLAATRKQLVSAARNAGMAEIASNVLHNVGNVLNSINTSAFMIHERAERERLVSLLEKLTSKLKEADKERVLDTERVAELLGRITRDIRKEREVVLAESGKLFSRVQEIRGLLKDQDRFVKVEGQQLESVDLASFIDHYIREELVLPEEARCTVRCKAEAVPPVTLDRQKLARVLFFLTRNAVSAVQFRDKEGSILFSTAAQDDHVLLRITDNGMGLNETERQNLFTQDGSENAFGLHYCANTVREMAGDIQVQSPGRGAGTTVTLSFLRAPEMEHQN